MREPSDLPQAKEWYLAQSESTKEELRKCIELVLSSLYGVDDDTIVSQCGSKVRKGLGMAASLVLSDRAMVEKCLFYNGMLLLYRLFGKIEKDQVLDHLLSLLEQFFSCFRFFLDASLSKTKKRVAIDINDASEAAMHLVKKLQILFFPEGELSIALPELPFMFQHMCISYLHDTFQTAVEQAQKSCTQFLLNQQLKEKIVIWLVLYLQKLICGLSQKPSLQGIDEKKYAHVLPRVEHIFEQAVFCLARDGQKAVSFCPKYKGGLLFLSGFEWFSTLFEKEGCHRFLHALTNFISRPRSSTSVCDWTEMENMVCDTSLYEPLFFRIAKGKAGSFTSLHGSFAPFQLLVHGFFQSVAESTFESLPWERYFQMILFGLRRIRAFSLSADFLVWIKNNTK